MHVCGFWKCSISERTIQMMQNCRKTSKKEEGEKKNSPKCNNNKNTKRNFSILCLASAKIKWKLQLTYMKVSIGFSVHFRSVRFGSVLWICNFCRLRNCISSLSMLRLRFQAQYLNNSISILNITSKYAFLPLQRHRCGNVVRISNMTCWSALEHCYILPKNAI